MHIRSAFALLATASLGVAALAMTGCQSTTTPTASAASSEPIPASFQMISADAQAAGKPALVVVGAEWCSACKRYEAGTLTDSSTRAAIDRVAYYKKVDFDQNKSDVRAMGITALPTTLLIVDGAPVARFTGAKSGDDLLAWIDANDG